MNPGAPADWRGGKALPPHLCFMLSGKM